MKRSNLQNASLHQYLCTIADKLNDAGYDFRKVVTLPVSFTTENVKESMFKPVLNAMFPDYESTTQLSTIELQQVYEVFNRAMAERLQVSADFPNKNNGGII